MAGADKNRGKGSEPVETEPFAAAADNDRDETKRDAATTKPLETDQLALDDESERLPWLDSDDDDDAEQADGGRVLGLVLLGLIALAAIVGGIWWSTHRTSNGTLVADGSTIAAPGQPYKEAPKNPGGKTFDGTGNTAFAVSEGQSRPARLGETTPPANASAKPGPAGAASPAASGSAAAVGAANAGAASGPVVQVGAYSTRASAEAAWGRMSQQYSALSGQRHQIVEGKADIGTVFRLQVLSGDAGAAQSLCGKLKASGLACQVK